MAGKELMRLDSRMTGKRIRFFLRRRGVCMEEVCDATGIVSIQALYKWFGGRSLPDPDNLYILSQLLEVPMALLLWGQGPGAGTAHRTGRMEAYGLLWRWRRENRLWMGARAPGRRPV